MQRLRYRTHQFWEALLATPASDDLEQARCILSLAQYHLFTRMQASEQAHALSVFRKVCAQGKAAQPLLRAALLHDIGKSCYPLQPWERVLIVLVKAFSPTLAQRWGQGTPGGWRRAFVVAEQHARWGAEMAQAAGSDPITVRLIMRHQDNIAGEPWSVEVEYLRRLQQADDRS